MEPYIHKVHYYETDKMGIVHHSNHIRWMEEARVDFLERIGAGFPAMEARGIYSPVVNISCRYRRPARFDDRIAVRVRIAEFKGVSLKFAYEMTNCGTGELVAVGASEHCFTDTNGKVIRLCKTHPDVDAVLRAAAEQATAAEHT